jgi:uncharacterized protein (DUF2249 family)
MQDTQEAERVVDVRDIPPQHRHAMIFQLFEHLGPEDSLQLVIDHNPLRLRFLLEASFASRCDWCYLEQGPDAWRVRLRHLRENLEVEGTNAG